MIEQLFGSKTRVKLLRLFFSNPNRSFFVREITRKIDEQINSVRRELSNLLSIGIISSNANDTNNNKLYYEVNQEYEFYKPLLTIFGDEPTQTVTKTKDADAATSQKQDILMLGNVEAALFTGRFTRDERSGIDFLIIGDINQAKLNKFIVDLEEKEGKEIRYTVMTLQEFQYRMQVKDRFLGMVLSAKYQPLVDKHNLITPKPEKTNKVKKGE